MKFNDFEYTRPDYEVYKKEADELLAKLKEAKNPKEFKEIFDKINVLRNHISTYATLASIRYSINTADEFYSKENDYWDENSPMYQIVDNELYKIAVNCPFREELYNDIPKTFFQIAENSIKVFDERIINLYQEENKLSSDYSKLIASAKIEFEGQTYNISQLKAKTIDNDRNVRKKAFDAVMGWFTSKQNDIDDVYDKLVKVRDKIAKELGYKNFIELGYLRMNRLDYDAEMIDKLRKGVLEYIVPVNKTFFDQQKERLNVDELRYYDESYIFNTGNPKPHGTPDDLVKAASKMYGEMSKETKEFFDTMVNMELFDLVSKPNKQGGGYCTDIPDYKVPFIFSNFNGTSGDVDVLTHEAGHAFQSYLTQKTMTIPECMFPTYESAEIHSMSMEFFAHPWMESFFKEDTNKYYYLHVASCLKFMPYGCLVDHFQHLVYENPNATKEERRKMWRDLEKQYLPHRNYEGCDILEQGCWWYQQGHIFASPFYYIDYVLAQVCALQFFVRMNKKDPNAWSDYINLCKTGGAKSFLGLVDVAGLKSPFEKNTIKDTVEGCLDYLKTLNVDNL